MYFSITIGDKNTFDDWHLLSAVKPIVVLPAPKFKYVDILGMSGSLDYTEALTKVPQYSDREGSWEFTILNPGDVDQYSIETEGSYKYDFDDLVSKIASYLHGKYFDRIILDTDPYHTYRGRVWINEVRTNSTWGSVVLNYRLKPFKYSLKNIAKNTIFVPEGNIGFNDAIIVPISIRSGESPTPLHFYATAPHGEVPSLVDVAFSNSELRLTASTIISDDVPGMSIESTLNRELVIKEMPVSNLNGGVCELRIGQLINNRPNFGPMTIDYWWEETSL